MSWFSYPNRVVCSVLDEMRKSLKRLNIFNIRRYRAHMSMLIEEAQTLVNRMEAGLEDKSDLRRVREKIKEEGAKLEKLKAKTAGLSKDGEDEDDPL